MLLRNIMEAKHKVVISANPSTKLNDAVNLLVTNNIGCLPVLDDDEKLIGIISERDILNMVNQEISQLAEKTVGDIMTKKLIKGSPEDNLSKIAEIMEENKIRHLPIVKGEKVIGLISLWEIYRAKMQNMETENRTLSHMLHGRDKTGDYDMVTESDK